MPARTGAAFLRGLRDDRELWVGGERVSDPADHPATRGAAHTLAAIFDLQHEYPDVCLIPDPETGEPIAASHMIPRSRADLERRHAALRKVAEFTVGLMGRTPDYMNVTFAGFAGRSDEWGANGNEHGAANLVAYQKELARRDLSLTHTLIHATVDKSKGNVPTGLDPTQLHKVKDTAHGILVRGARVLATLAPFSDEIAVYPSRPMPDASRAHALSFSIPMDTPGLKFLCRDSFSLPRDDFDHPLSGRFDEQDAFVIFDNVEVPRDRVFIDGNLPVYNSVMSASWRGNAMQQTMVRAHTKLEFAWGLANRMAEAIGASDPTTLQMLGEIWSYAELTRAAVYAGEQGALRVRQRRLVSRRAAIGRFARDAAVLVSPGQRDHFPDRLAQRAGDAERRPVRRARAAAADRHLSARGGRGQCGATGADFSPRLGFRPQRACRPQRAIRAVLSHLGRAQPDGSADARRPARGGQAGRAFPGRAAGLNPCLDPAVLQLWRLSREVTHAR